MRKVDFVFVILLYRNMEDIKEYLVNISALNINKRVVLVNNYYDEKTKEESNRIAIEFNCDILQCENRGYGYGNNQGIRFAKNNYDYNYIIVSNPDILINRFDENRLLSMRNCVVGPIIHTLKGKNQNPYWCKPSPLFERLLYLGMKRDISILRYIAFAYFRFIREIALLTKRSSFEVYALHGSFVLFHKDVIEKLDAVYDEAIFMYSEEVDVAYRLRELGIKSIVLKDMDVIHKEDGSVKLSSLNINQMMKDSFIKYYEKRRLI